MTRRVMPGSGIKRKLTHVIVVLKSAKRPAKILDGPRMAISKSRTRNDFIFDQCLAMRRVIVLMWATRTPRDGAGDRGFEVLGEAATPAEPCIGPFDDPAAR